MTRHDDRLIAVKRATADGCERRRREAHLLARLAHPGVVQFVDLIEGDPTELHMTYAGTDSWERCPPTSERAIVEGLAAVASTVADLHDLGTTHQTLGPEHVLVTSEHRPVLCGLADAEPADPVTCADDLAGMARLINHVSPAASDELRIRLDRLATRALAGEISARRLTDELDALRREETTARRPPRTTPRPATVAAAVAALTLLLVVGWWLRRPDSTTTEAAPPISVEEAPAPPPAQAPPPATVPPSTSRPTRPTPSTIATAMTAVPEPLVVVHEGRRFGVGRQGDIILLGDWNCDGIATPALLETDRDRVAVFPAWPEAESALEPGTTIVIADAADLELVTADGCDQLRVIHSRGTTLFTPEFP